MLNNKNANTCIQKKTLVWKREHNAHKNNFHKLPGVPSHYV